MKDRQLDRGLRRYLNDGKITSAILLYCQEKISLSEQLVLIINQILRCNLKRLEDIKNDSRILMIRPTLIQEEGEIKAKNKQRRLRKADIEAGIDFIKQTTGGVFLERVLIIERIETADRFAANLLLKLLEDLPAEARIIITSEDLSNVLMTIRSRCLLFEISRSIGEKPISGIDLKEYSDLKELITKIYDLNLGVDGLTTLLPPEQLKKLISSYPKLPERLPFFSYLLECLTPNNLSLTLNLLKHLIVNSKDPIKLRRLFGYSEEEILKITKMNYDNEELLRIIARFEDLTTKNLELDFDLQKTAFITKLIDLSI